MGTTTGEIRTRQVSWVLAATDQGLFIVNRNDHADMGSGSYGVGHDLLNYGVYCPEVAETLVRALRVRRRKTGHEIVALDIGANIGVYTVVMARCMVGWGKVYAYEPQERLFYALCGNILLNNVSNAFAYNEALTFSNGQILVPELDFDKPASYGSLNIVEPVLSRDLGVEVPVEAKIVTTHRIDNLNHGPDLVKIDVEGMEMAVLGGAMMTLRQYKPILVVEIHKSGPGVTDFLIQLGYKTKLFGADLIAVHDYEEAHLLGLN